MKKNNKILLHACCAICSAYPITKLRELGYEPVVFFYNPNIQPDEEYFNRLEAQRMLCQKFECELIEGTYDSKMFGIISFGLDEEPEGGIRCNKCFELRLVETAKKAKEIDINIITTSIVISPYKQFDVITQIGQEISHQFGVDYLDINFKKQDGFLKSNKIAKDLNLYRQNYCGCLYSLHNK